MKQFRLLLLLALLMTAVTGAWAQTSDKETPLTLQATADGKISISDPKVGMKYKVGNGDKQTVTGTDDVTIVVNEGQTVQFFGNGTEITAYGVEEGYGTCFDSSVPCCIYGNIMSLVNEDDFAKATELTGDYAFRLLFSYFSNLSNHASRKLVLPAMTLTKECYYGMFIGSGLTEAPALPAQKLAEGCYENMFSGSTGLTAAPELPATELATQCYQNMFEGCSSLTAAPLLPATTLAQQCYNWMFDGCTNLNAVTCLATNISAQGATYGWLKNVAATGTLTIAKGTEDKWAAKSTADGIPSGWTTDVYGFKVKLADGTADAGNWTATVGEGDAAEPLPVAGLNPKDAVTLKYNGHLKVKSVTATTDAELVTLATPLTIEAISAGTIQVYIDGTLSTGMKYSVNGGDKVTITQTTEIPVAKGDKVQFYGNGTSTQAYGNDPKVKILGSGDGFQTKVYGNIMSLLDEDDYATKYTVLPYKTYVFNGLFMGNTTLTDASELLLPAMELRESCYNNMFSGCTSLTTAPKLPAMTLVMDCYVGMFSGCTSLTSAYVKAAYTEKGTPCLDMFDGCEADGAVLHTTSDNKPSWENMMGSDKTWETWTVVADWQD